MTKINRISIHGFKSFANKTDIPFDEKFNCILGPNGSGKSNCGDALCFVLGRLSAKSMRAEKAANLIFNGGKGKKPSAAGSVEIAFCNKNKIFPTEGKEVVINRMITKKGSSVYRVNGKKKTRTEILDLLSLAKVNPDGYNIVLQGDIMKFVDMSPLERRKIIEEISDVSIYEDKKHKALMELDKVEEKLNSAEIILKERKTYLRELKKDRDQALKFKELKDKIDSNKATYLHYQMQDRLKIKEKHDKEISKYETNIKDSEEKIVTLKEKVESFKQEIDTINKEIEKKGEKAQLEVHRQIEDLKVKVAEDKTRMSTLKDEISKIQQRKDQLQEDIKELEQKSSSSSEKNKGLQQNIQKKKRELQQLEDSIAQFKKKHKIESSGEIDKEIDDKDKLIDAKQEEVQIIRQKQQELLRGKDRIEYQLQGIDERMNKVKEVEKENQEQVKTLQQKKTDFKNATLRLNSLLDQDSSYGAQMNNARKELSLQQEKQANLNAKTLSIQAGLSGNQAVKAVLDRKTQGVFGTIMELGQVNRKYAQALETAAGAKMHNIVVENDKIASDCIAYLKSSKQGSASFIPLNKIRYQQISQEDKKLTKTGGVHDFALNLITYKPQFEKAFANVFGNTLVVDDIETARKVGIGRIKMATMDGNMAEASGIMRGGFKAVKKAGFRERDSLEELERCDAEVAELQSVLANVDMKREGNLKEISALRNAKAELEAEIIKLEKTLHLETGDLDASNTLKKELKKKLVEIDEDASKVSREVSTINRELAELKSKKQMLRMKVNELRNPRHLAQLQAFEESRQQCRESILKDETEFKNSTEQQQTLFQPEIEKISEILKQHSKEEVQFKEEIKNLSDKVKDNEKDLTLKEKASKEFYSKYQSLFSKRDKFSTDMNKADNEIERIREKMRVNERELNLMSLKNAEVKAKLAGLEEEFKRYKDVEIFKNKPIEELQKEINKFEVMLAQMSAVNMKALEVYDQVETEFNKLVEKKESLTVEKTDVLTLMNEIETKKKDHFMKTFDEAQNNFTKIFNSLFKKGKAYLQLDNPDKPFEDGLSIKVKLTGNRFMDIKSLSGGEKTLTALSFIFAIQEYQPASFYILDEIDAALDKHNSETLAKLIRNYANRAQYIIISHNDSIISEADSLFGVSMSDGVSKITSLQI